LLLPGLMCDRVVWSETMAALPGENPIDVAAYGELDTLGLMAERVLDLAPPRFGVAGHSMGGRVAFEVFRQAPERVAGIALLDTTIPRAPRAKPARARSANAWNCWSWPSAPARASWASAG